jgi:hypothetical protein
MVDPQPSGEAATQDPPSEEDRSEIGQRAAYEAELNRISSTEMILQTAVSLINIGGRRLGLAPGGPGGPPAAGRDLEQVRDAIDAASALLPILERRMPRELSPLRDAIAQLQVAYAREVQTAGNATSGAPPQAVPAEQAKPAEAQEKPPEGDSPPAPGPAQASGRLWVPGR